MYSIGSFLVLSIIDVDHEATVKKSVKEAYRLLVFQAHPCSVVIFRVIFA